MREQRWGRIVTVGSMNGRVAFPGMGYYCATKHALEAISDALRHELRPFGVEVSLIQPGMVKTAFGNAAAARRTAEADGAYADYNEQVADTAANWQSGPMAKLACGPEDVAETILKAIDAGDRSRARYRVAASAPLMLDHSQAAARRRLRRVRAQPVPVAASPPRRGSARPPGVVMLAL